MTSQRRWEAYDKLGTFAIYVISTILVIQVGVCLCVSVCINMWGCVCDRVSEWRCLHLCCLPLKGVLTTAVWRRKSRPCTHPVPQPPPLLC